MIKQILPNNNEMYYNNLSPTFHQPNAPIISEARMYGMRRTAEGSKNVHLRPDMTQDRSRRHVRV
jgi:hypothetical protein